MSNSILNVEPKNHIPTVLISTLFSGHVVAGLIEGKINSEALRCFVAGTYSANFSQVKRFKPPQEVSVVGSMMSMSRNLGQRLKTEPGETEMVRSPYAASYQWILEQRLDGTETDERLLEIEFLKWAESHVESVRNGDKKKRKARYVMSLEERIRYLAIYVVLNRAIDHSPGLLELLSTKPEVEAPTSAAETETA